MVVIYDRFVFFSVEKFFIPLLYSCLNILVQRSCVSACTHVDVSVRENVRVCMRVCCEQGGASRESTRDRWGMREMEMI